MSINVTNGSQKQIQVAFNQWGSKGNTDYVTLASGDSDSWDRTDQRGYVMAVNLSGTQTPYYVQAGSNIVIRDNDVLENGLAIRSAS